MATRGQQDEAPPGQYDIDARRCRARCSGRRVQSSSPTECGSRTGELPTARRARSWRNRCLLGRVLPHLGSRAMGSPRRGSRRPFHRSHRRTRERSGWRPVLERQPAQSATRLASLPSASLTAGSMSHSRVSRHRRCCYRGRLPAGGGRCPDDRQRRRMRREIGRSRCSVERSEYARILSLPRFERSYQHVVIRYQRWRSGRPPRSPGAQRRPDRDAHRRNGARCPRGCSRPPTSNRPGRCAALVGVIRRVGLPRRPCCWLSS